MSNSLREVTQDGIRLCDRDSSALSIPMQFAPLRLSPPMMSFTLKYVEGLSGTTWAPRRRSMIIGVTLTHGTVGAREHIWTFVTGLEEDQDNTHSHFYVPVLLAQLLP